MRRIILLVLGTVIFVTILAAFLFFYRIKQPPHYDPEATVAIHQTAQGYQLAYHQKPYEIKGVAGHTYLQELKTRGGNTIRTWDTKNIGGILDSAELLDIKVIVGLPLPSSRVFDYGDGEKVEAMLQPILANVEAYKNHPALLMWGVGNEVVFYPNSISKLVVYRTLNRLAKQIKVIDPNHPTTTMVLYSKREFFFLNYFYRHLISFPTMYSVSFTTSGICYLGTSLQNRTSSPNGGSMAPGKKSKPPGVPPSRTQALSKASNS